MADRPGIVTIHGNPLTLVGQEVQLDQPAPDFEVLANDLSPFKFSSLNGKVAIISSVPSLDTPTCNIETRWFNEEAAKLGPDITILTISMDLPFAQARWCGAAGVERVKTYSDHRVAAFGLAYGVLIKELRCWPGLCSWWINRGFCAIANSSRRCLTSPTTTRFCRR